MTLTEIAKACNVSLHMVYIKKIELGIDRCKRITDKEAELLVEAINNRRPKGMTLSALSKKYKVSLVQINQFKKVLGYTANRCLTKDEYKKLEAVVKADDTAIVYKENKLTTEERCKVVSNRLKADGYIRSKDITALFNGRHISGSVTAIENILGIELYEDTLKELKFGKTEDSKSGDKYKYKYTRIYRDMAGWLEICNEEAKKDCHQPGGRVVTNARSYFGIGL